MGKRHGELILVSGFKWGSPHLCEIRARMRWFISQLKQNSNVRISK